MQLQVKLNQNKTDVDLNSNGFATYLDDWLANARDTVNAVNEASTAIAMRIAWNEWKHEFLMNEWMNGVVWNDLIGWV